MDALLWDHSINEDAKEVPSALKPEEEIARFTVDEHLSDVERVNLFLAGGQPVQQYKAIEGLAALLKARGRSGWEAVRANLFLALKQLGSEAQVLVAEGLRSVVQQRALPAADAADCLLTLALSNVTQKDKAEEESEAWLLLLLELVPVLGPEHLLAQVLPLALAHGEVNETVAGRVVCCRLLGAMTPHLPLADVLARVAPQLLGACQDTDYQVRISAAEQLPVLGRVLGPASSVEQLLPELSELLADDEVQVRMAALNGLVALCELLPHEARSSRLLPLVRAHMQPLELELPLQRTLAAAFPRLLAAIRTDLEPTDAGLMYSCFRHLAARADVELRRTCAACVSELMATPLPGSSPSHLHDTWTDLAMDHDEQVRVAIAGQLHVLTKQAPPSEAARLLRRPLAALLRDTSPHVREALLAGLADTLQALSGVDDLHREGLGSDIHQGLLVMQGNIADSWRCQQHLASALPHLPSLLGPEQLSEHWAPYAFGLLLNGAVAVKPAAARGLASLLRGCRRERPRTELYCRVMRELAWGRSCFARLAYIQLCIGALAVFSCRWFKEHLLLPVMELLSDAVPNVRLAALGLLPALKQTIRLPEDVQHLEQLNSAMSNLMTDNDRDVAHAARSLHTTFKRTPLRTTGGAGLLDINGASSAAAAAEFEASDKAKEEAEAELTMTPEDLDRLNAEWMAVTAERRNRRNPMLALVEATSGSGSSGSKGSTQAGRCVGTSKGPAGGSSGNSSTASGYKPGGSGSTLGPAGIGGTGSTGSSNTLGSSSFLGGTGRSGAAAVGSTGSSSSLASVAGWTAGAGSSYDRRLGSGAPSSSSSSPAGVTGLRGAPSAAAAAAAAAGFGSLNRMSNNRTAGSSSSIGSPRPGVSGSSSSLSSVINSSISNGPGGLSGISSSSPLSSPTGSSLLAHMRLPVLAAGSPKATAAGSSSSNISSVQAAATASSSTPYGSSSSSAISGGLAGASRMGWSSSLGSLGSPTAAAAATAGRQQPGSLGTLSAAVGSSGSSRAGGSTSNSTSSSSSSMFGRQGDASKGTGSSSSSKAGMLLGKAGGTSTLGGSAGLLSGSSKGASQLSRSQGTASAASTASTREAAASRRPR